MPVRSRKTEQTIVESVAICLHKAHTMPLNAGIRIVSVEICVVPVIGDSNSHSNSNSDYSHIRSSTRNT